MPKLLKIDKGVEAGVRELLQFLLESKKVRAVFALRAIGGGDAVAHSLITAPEQLQDAVPFFPVMPGNAAESLARLTWGGPVSEPVAVVLRPCELRAFVELAKRKQGHLENFLFVSSTCGGVYPLETAVNGDLRERVAPYWEAVKKGENAPGLRDSCRGCEHFLPYTADMTVALIGEKDADRECRVFLNTETGAKYAEGMKGEITEGEIPTKETEELKLERGSEKKRRFAELETEKPGMSGLMETFGKCMGCHVCGKVCPICYCGFCFFESRANEYKPHTYDVELKKRGAVRVPPDTIFYHLGRLSHMSVSCVGCGMCTDACPAGIPISTVYQKVGEAVQEMFDYLPGRDVGEAVPVKVFEKEELAEVET